MDKSIRLDPPAREPNNQDVFLWALYQLGGADKDVDVEEIYLKCFEMAPARLGWRTHPEIPDYKKTSKALQSVEATTHVGLIHRPHQYARRLTAEGVTWVTDYESILREVYSGKIIAPSKSTNQYEHLRSDLKRSNIWLQFESGVQEFEMPDLANALRCSATSTLTTWNGRVTELKRAAQVLSDENLTKFANLVIKNIAGKISK